MTKAVPFTEAAVRRAIAAARKEGMTDVAVSIAPDGTITIFPQRPIEPPSIPTHDEEARKWADA